MNDNFKTKFFVDNRARLRRAVAADAPIESPIVVTANGLLQRNGDSTYRFRQDSNFWYLSGIAEPDILLVIDKDEEYLIVPWRDSVREAFDGLLSPEALAQRSGVKTILDDKTGWDRLGKRLRGTKSAATITAPPRYIEQQGFYPNPARIRLTKRLKEYDLAVTDIREPLTRLRSIKQSSEVEAIQQAVDITIDGLKHVMALVANISGDKSSKYRYEYEIEADLSREFRRHGYFHAFDPIIASGQRACQMHYLANNGALTAGDLLIFDVGAEAGHYAADIARTILLPESVPKPKTVKRKRQQQVYDAVCDVQDYALTLLKPGTINVEYEKQVEIYMGEKLRELGLVRTTNQIVERDVVRKYFPHAATHFLGLDVHDVGDYGLPMEPGMVMVCEPGIYIPEEGIGVRIEDDILITADGHKVLTAKMPRGL